jgi:hypothetical protein
VLSLRFHSIQHHVPAQRGADVGVPFRADEPSWGTNRESGRASCAAFFGKRIQFVRESTRGRIATELRGR